MNNILFVCYFTSCTGILSTYGNFTIVSEELQKLSSNSTKQTIMVNYRGGFSDKLSLTAVLRFEGLPNLIADCNIHWYGGPTLTRVITGQYHE